MSFPDSSKPSNFSTAVKLGELQIDVRTNGPHESLEDVVTHAHSGFEVQAALSGTYCLAFADRQLQIRAPDTVCLIPPDCPHRSGQAEAGTRLISLRFSCRKRSAQGEAAALAEVMAQRMEEPVLLSGEPELCAALKGFSRELVAPELASQLLLDSLLQEIFIRLFRSIKKQRCISREEAPEREVRTDRYSQIEAFFQDNYEKPITEQDLATVLAVSKRQTSRILREQCGKSFHEKLEEVRMSRAQQYLRLGELTVEEIAFRVGYASASGFFVAFKKRFGMTPTRYRRARQR